MIWSELEDGVNDAIHALQSHDGALFAGGDFLSAGLVGAMRIARWDGSLWSPFNGLGMDEDVYALQLYGGNLYAGGDFQVAGSCACESVARWNGSAGRH